MSLALLANTAPRIISILGANPGVWSTTVSGKVGAFPADNEITAAQLEADEWIATQCYFQSYNRSLRQPFLTTATIVNRDPIPQFHGGALALVEYSGDNVNWFPAQKEDAKDVIAAFGLEGYVQTGAYDHLYAINEGKFLSTASYNRITYPVYTRSSVLQCNKNEESLIVFRSVAILAKNASPALFAEYDQKAETERQRIIQEGMMPQENEE
jgi:hypothetical protein